MEYVHLICLTLIALRLSRGRIIAFSVFSLEFRVGDMQPKHETGNWKPTTQCIPVVRRSRSVLCFVLLVL